MKKLIWGIIISILILQSCTHSSTFGEMQSTEGYQELVLLTVDTTYAAPYPYDSGRKYLERLGRFIYYYDNNGKVDTFFANLEVPIISGYGSRKERR